MADHLLHLPSELAAPPRKPIAVPVIGDCMEPEIREGDVVVFETTATPQDGDIALVPSRAQVGRYRLLDDGSAFLVGDKYPDNVFEVDREADVWPAVMVSRPLLHRRVRADGLTNGTTGGTI